MKTFEELFHLPVYSISILSQDNFTIPATKIKDNELYAYIQDKEKDAEEIVKSFNDHSIQNIDRSKQLKLMGFVITSLPTIKNVEDMVKLCKEIEIIGFYYFETITSKDEDGSTTVEFKDHYIRFREIKDLENLLFLF